MRVLLSNLLVGTWLVLALVTVAGSLGVAASSDGTALTIEGIWARAASEGHNSAVYMRIANDGPHDIAIVSAAADVADRVEIHETTMELTVVDGRVSQIMRMAEIERLVVPAGGMVELKPGGLHVMLLGLTRNLEEGDTFSLTLHTQDGGTVVMDVPVTVGHGADDHNDHHDHHDHHH